MKRLVLVIAAWFIVSPALGHGEFAWINQRDKRTGDSCCGEHDCFKVDTDFDEKRQVYKFSVNFFGEMTAYEVPFKQAKPSEDGRFWACTPKPGVLRCFFAPPMGS